MGDLTRGETFANGEQVTPARLHALVESAELVAGCVGTAELADGVVTTAKIAGTLALPVGNVAITSGKLLGGGATNFGVEISPDASTVEISSTTLRVKDAGITAAKLGTDAVTAVKILADAVTTAKIVDAAVTYAKIQDVSAASRLLGRGSAGGSGDAQELTVGAGLSISGTALVASNAVTLYDSGLVAVPAAAAAWASGAAAHFLGGVPHRVHVSLVCATTQHDHVADDEIPVAGIIGAYSGSPFSVVVNAATVKLIRNASETSIFVTRRDSVFGWNAITDGNWRVRVLLVRYS